MASGRVIGAGAGRRWYAGLGAGRGSRRGCRLPGRSRQRLLPGRPPVGGEMSGTLEVLRSLGLFVAAGVCEIGGGWLVWKWLRDGRPSWWGLLGGLVLVLYGIIPTLQAAHFGRVYAVYGGFFIVLSLLWGWCLDGSRPDAADV